MEWLFWLGVLAVVVLFGVGLPWGMDWYFGRKREALMRAHAAVELEFLQHVRRTMEDLRDRDPMIAESIELALHELAWQERWMVALRDGASLRTLLAMKREQEREG